MDSLSPNSYWNVSSVETLPAFPALSADRRVDVAVIGAGITGLTAALQLKRAGKQVVVLEAGRVGAGTTGGTSGHLEVMPDQGLRQLIKDFGEAGAREIVGVRGEAIDQIERYCAEVGIECDFQRVPAYAYTESPERADRLRDESQAAQSIGLSCQWRGRLDLPFPVAGAMQIDSQARFHSLAYLRALAHHLHGGNATICEHTAADPPQDGSPCAVHTASGTVLADEVILATHSAFLGISQFDMRQAAYQSYVLAVRVRDRVPDALYWDDEAPYHYIRLAASNDPGLLIVGGADHKTGQADTPEHFVQLSEYVSQHFDVERIEQRWSAELFEPADGVPYIGRVPLSQHLYLATGYSGTGLTYGTAAGMLLADLILGREPPAAELFSPSRLKPLAAGWDLLTENLNVAKRFVTDRLAGEKIESLDEVRAGEGRLVSYEGEQCAVYREPDGRLHVLSPVCTHAGCHVRWNAAESTWDCPCHGGRYAATGQRLYGPPPGDLSHRALERPEPVAASEAPRAT